MQSARESARESGSVSRCRRERGRGSRIALAAALAALCAAAERAPAQELDPNLGLALAGADGLPLLAQGGLVAFPVDEQSQGEDLDGDGVVGASVLHVFDAASGATANTRFKGFAAGAGVLSVEPGGVFFVALESEAERDLNADGDLADAVPQRLRSPSGEITAVGLALSPARLVSADGGRLAFAVQEEAEDLNGDGDRVDEVLHSFDASTGRVTNHRRAVSALQLRGNLLAALVPEIDQARADLNADGDAIDRVAVLIDLASGETTPLNLAIGTRFSLIQGRLVFTVSEAEEESSDLNGDGDVSDDVLHVFDPATGRTQNLGAVPAAGSPLLGAGRTLAFLANEVDGGADLNGDGDPGDAVLLSVDVATGAVSPLGEAVGAARVFAVTPDLVVFSVSEFGEAGGTDLNGDGDTSDAVLHVFAPGTGAVSNLGLALGGSPDLLARGPLVAVNVRERDQGVDLNGDGGIDDHLALHVYDGAREQTRNLEVRGERFALGDDLVAYLTPEIESDDLNGDGDILDRVVQVFRPASGEVESLAASDRSPVVRGRWIAVAVSETGERRTDRNGDGDTSDAVLTVFDGASGRALDSRRAVQGVVLTSQLAVFSVPEVSQGGSDLNGDGDAADRIVHVLPLAATP